MHTRREMLARSASVAAALAGLGLLPQAAQAAWSQAAFDAKNMGDLMKALGTANPAESKDVTITGPDIAENGAVVPVGAATTLPGVKRLLLLDVRRHRRGRAEHLHAREDGPVVQRVRRGDHRRQQGALRGQGNQGHARRLRRLKLRRHDMADPMRIRAQAQGDKTTVRVLMSHEMETGQRKDTAGKTIPAWFIQEVSASHNGKPVMTAQWGPSVAKNPFLQFTIKGAKAGDKVAVNWKDNKGDSRTDEATVT